MTVTGYHCPVHGGIRKCEIDEIGERTCPECGRFVTAVTGGIDLA